MAGIFPLRTCKLCGKRMRGPLNVCGECVDAIGNLDGSHENTGELTEAECKLFDEITQQILDEREEI